MAPPSTSTNRRPRVLLGVTGSVAAVKGPEISVRTARDLQYDVCILLTRGGLSFWTKAQEYNPSYWSEMKKRLNDEEKSANQAEGRISVIDPEEEWKGWNRLGDPVLHIELRDWADICVIAPLSAHTLAKLANGLCDDTLSCVLRAWDYGHGERPGKALILAPAMNTAMWQHPLTQTQLATIQSFWNTKRSGDQNEIHVVEPQVKTLACGEVGTGGLASVDDILVAIARCCSNTRTQTKT